VQDRDYQAPAHAAHGWVTVQDAATTEGPIVRQMILDLIEAEIAKRNLQK
jgi:hypothetical protein